MGSEIHQALASCQQFQSETEELLSSIVELVPLPIAIVDLGSNEILASNQALESVLGVAEGVALKLFSAYCCFRPGEAQWMEQIRREGSSLTDHKFQFRRTDGTVFETAASVKPVRYQNKPSALWVLTNPTPVTPSIPRSLHNPQQLNQVLAAAVHYTSDAVEITDAQARLEYVNPAFESVTGYTPAEAIGKTPADLLRSDHHDEDFYQDIWQTISNGSVWSGYITGKHKDGQPLRQEVTVSPIQNDQGEIVHYVALRRDITQSRQMEHEWLKFVALVEHSNDFIAMSSLEGEVLYVNEAGRRLVGLDSLEEALSKPIADYLPEDDLAQFCEITLPTLKTTGRHTSEGKLRHFKTGNPIHVHRSCFAVKHPQTGEVMCLATIQRDITAQKQAETALKESEERFRTIAQTLPLPMVITRVSDGTILYANAQIEETFGLASDQFIGRKSLDFYENPLDRATLLKQLRKYSYLHNYQVRAKKADGTPFWVSISLRFLTFNGESALLGVFCDITDQKQAEVNLRTLARQQAAVATLGQDALAGLDLPVLMEEAARLVAQTLDVNYCGVFERQPGGHALLLKAGLGWQPGLVGSAFIGAQANSQVGYTLLSREPVIVEDLRIETRFGGPPLLHNHRVVSGISVVIPGQEHPFGVLGCYTTQLRPFRQDDIHFLQAIANVLATAIERQQSESRLHLMERAIAASSNGIVLTDANQPDNPIIYANPAFEAMTGYTVAEALGRNCRFLQGRDTHQPGLEELRAALREHRECHVILQNYRKDGTLFWNELRIAPVFDGNGYLTHFVGIQTDISDRKRMEDQLVHDAFYDALTGLPNRALFMDRLKQAIARAHRYPDELFAVLFLDLDRFKVVNDSLGHMVGDQLLVAIAQRLQACLRPSDTIARLGGDEFTILLDPIRQESDATTVAERIHEALRFPLNLDGYEVFTTSSIGIALSTTGYQHPEEVLRDADTALYRAKEQGKSCYAVFDKDMYDQAVNLLQLETDLRWAIKRQELRVYYQPIVSLKTGYITGFEALVRWHHPERGLISPAEFIPIAEETGLVTIIGQWVLQESCHQLQQWRMQFPAYASLTMSVNLSSKQLSQPNLLERIDHILRATHLTPESLKLELTESAIMNSPEAAALTLQQLKHLGIQLCVDDFGTGYSSLAYLHRFPIDVLKIDRSFVSRIDEDGEQLAIVRAIATLADSLGMSVVAEGIETPQQLLQLKRLHCEQGQGYLFAKPLNREAAEMLLAELPIWQAKDQTRVNDS